MQFDEVTADRQAQAQATILVSRAGIGLTETFEQMRQELGGNADPIVGDRRLDMRVDAFTPDLNPAALRRKLDRVRTEVPEYLSKAIGISRHERPSWIDDDVKTNLLRVGGWLGGLDRLPDDRRHFDIRSMPMIESSEDATIALSRN